MSKESIPEAQTQIFPLEAELLVEDYLSKIKKTATQIVEKTDFETGNTTEYYRNRTKEIQSYLDRIDTLMPLIEEDEE